MAITGKQFGNMRSLSRRTQSEIAVLFGVHVKTISKWESSPAVPKLAELAMYWLTGLESPPIVPINAATYPELYKPVYNNRRIVGYERRPNHPDYGKPY